MSPSESSGVDSQQMYMETSRDIVLEARNIGKSFDGKTLLNQLDFLVEKGKTTTLVGPGGSGKSVLMKILALTIPPDSGKVLYFNTDVTKLKAKELQQVREQMGFLFQNYALFDSLNVEDNISFFMRRKREHTKAEIKEKVANLLELVRLPGIEHLRPDQLSGGMKKRVGMARALIHQPEILFLDEPVAGLDPVTSKAIIKLIKNLQEVFHCTTIMVSNELACTYALSDNLAILFGGAIYKIGRLEEMQQTDDAVVRQFLEGKKDGPIKY
jgi:phospholipid/cholesterol/gamma-HCH transport system ATP-binding protein